MSEVFVFVLCIIAIVVISRLLREYMHTKAARPQEDPEYRTRIEALEERVRTLERIVTDKDYELKREFEKL